MKGNEAPNRPVGLSVIMPYYNEALIAEGNVVETLNTLRDRCDRSFEIVAVDDGSTDGTANRIRALTETHPEVRLVQLPANGGKGEALRSGLPHTLGALICFLDGDLDIHPSHITSFVRNLEAERVDIVIGSKRHPHSKVNYSLKRRVLSFAHQLLVRGIFRLRIRDSQVGIKLFRREVLERVFTIGLVKQYAFDAELLVIASRFGYRILEAPIAMDFPRKLRSGVDLKAIIKMFQDTLGIFYRLRITHYYGSHSDFDSGVG